MLIDEIKVSDIQINKDAKDWKEAIHKASVSLIESKKILPSYVDAMISVVEEKGPYIVITKHIALAHARPEHGVLEKGLSFTTFGVPVPFGSELLDPVKLIITLAATDSESHLDLLSELADILTDESKTEKMFVAKNEQVFLDVLKSTYTR
ncbi:PTS sugar transporter subunit IIA [Peribacillus psychrosaccharolyticus]|uniref:Ascorbate-specific PTS system EIIA component n=1 Tax=Peribacillus psychrosaccharolyticus TaxID=1407 RepID=A0A974NMK2_PERPY|nr:PTS sugar transporter subunit IIA [Peribacillus psychrosaccharolyticus]QQT00634.1 PTS sugar transporter subunit IIA [Peribacillus psychrosaccharolyticus]